MKVEVKEPKPWQRILKIDAPLDLMNEEVVQLYKEYGKDVALPGFRKGRVPEPLIKAKYGKAIERQALERAIPRIYEQALKETDEKPITKAIVEDVNYRPEVGLSFKAVFEVIPPVNVKGYKGISLQKRARRVTRGRIRGELDSLRQLHRELVTADREAEERDYVAVDYACEDELGKPLDGCSGSDYSLFLSGEGLSAGLLGCKRGERKEVFYRYPDDWDDRRLAGKRVLYRFAVKEVKETVLPKLDNDFARDVGFDSLKRLRREIKRRLVAQDEKAAREELEFQLVEKLIQLNPFDPSPSLIEGYLSEMVEGERRRVPAGERVDEERLRAEQRPLAEYRARRGIILDRIAEIEHIEVSEKELEEKIRELARGSRMEYEALRSLLETRGQIAAIEVGLRRDKTVESVLNNACIRTIRRRGE